MTNVPKLPFSVLTWDGHPITEQGVYGNIPIDVYHGPTITRHHSISSTGLRNIYNPVGYKQTSPAHYWCQSPYNPEREEFEENESIILGRAAHHLIFGEKRFNEVFIKQPEILNGLKWHGNRLDCKGWVTDQKVAGKTIVTVEQINRITGIANRLESKALVRNGLLNGLIEHSMFACEPETGVWLRGRPDAIPGASLDFVDMKTVRSIRPGDIQKSIEGFGYYQQGALINQISRLLWNEPINSFTLVFCESVPPHAIAIRTLKPHELDRGERVNMVGLRKFAACMKSGKWPDPDDEREDKDAAYIEMSEWAGKRIDEELARQGA